MIQLKIDNIDVSVPEGTTILKAAQSLGIEIPTMCFLEGNSNHPSCMVCVVKDNHSGMLYPSCAMPVSQGMQIETNTEEVKIARREALELLLSDHVGDCEAPCRMACPAFMDIPKMNRLIASGKFTEALDIVMEEIALPGILGYICSAPCEKVCRRKQVDEPVSICMLKRFTAIHHSQNQKKFFPIKLQPTGKKIAIIGAGISGLSCAFHLLKLGHNVTIFESNFEAGGSLLNAPENELPKVVLQKEIQLIEDYGADFKYDFMVTPEFFTNEIRKNFDAIVFATGEVEKSNFKEFKFKSDAKNDFLVDESGIFVCGSAAKPIKMAVKTLAQGKECAYAVNKFLGGVDTPRRYDWFNSKFGLLEDSEISEYMSESENNGKQIIPAKGYLAGYTADEAIAEAKRCMHCDCRKVENCKLRDYATHYQANRKRFTLSERKAVRKHLNHSTVIYEPEKCIRCGLCIDIASKHKEKLGLTFIGRGFEVRIDIPFGKELSEALSDAAIECARACPTGAISER